MFETLGTGNDKISGLVEVGNFESDSLKRVEKAIHEAGLKRSLD